MRRVHRERTLVRRGLCIIVPVYDDDSRALETLSSTIMHGPRCPDRSLGEPALNAPARAALARERDDEAPKHPLLVALGERVRTLRARRGMTRKARRAGRERLRAPSRESRVRHRQCVDPRAAAGGHGVAMLARRAARRRHDVVARMAADPRAARASRRRRPAPRARRVVRDVRLAGRADVATTASRSSACAAPARRRSGRCSPTISACRSSNCRARSSGSRAAACRRSTRSTARTPTAATSGARSRRRSSATPEAVIATPGGLVSDPATFNLLLANCFTVWLQASPEDHMRRVAEQGDLRPMAASKRSDGGPAAHPVRARGVLFESGSRDRHQRGAAGGDVPGAARQRAAGARAPGLAGT